MRSQPPVDEAVEVLRRFQLTGMAARITRCLRCGCPLEPISLTDALERPPAGIRDRVKRVVQCRGCLQLFWEGSCFPRLEALAAEMLARAAALGDPEDRTAQPPAKAEGST
jgi:uncharacterized protein with PIN domain